MYLVFYDDRCVLCQNMVQTLSSHDSKKLLHFESLYADKAQCYGIYGHHSLVLVDGDKLYFAGKAALRIFWCLGGWYRCLGVLSFLPSWLLDPFYYYVANRRYQ